MGKLVKLLSAAGAVALLSGCAGWDEFTKATAEAYDETITAISQIDDPLADNYDAARAATPEGGDFNRHLHGGYLKLATAERAEYDWADSAAFSDKALAAAQGQDVGPDTLYDRSVPKSKRDELTQARKKLTTALSAGGRTKAPENAAKAQTSFDCWIQEQEENHQSRDIDACRNEFYAALGEVDRKMGGKLLALSNDYLVYFGFNSTKLSDEASATLAGAAKNLASGKAKRLILAGHSDQAGPGVYNFELSERRVNAVRQFLLSSGVKAEQISISAFGDTQPRVAVPDNTAEPQNRRVEINLIK